MTESAKVRFGIIGTGRITRRLVADLQSTDGVDVTAIASRTDDRARWYADQYGIAAAVTGYEPLLQRDDVDAVYISLPPSMHAQWSIAAAQHGKHVLCEKPLATTTEEALAMDRACREHRVRWLDATGWLHHERTAAFGRWIDEQKFGAISHITAAVSFYQPFQSHDHRLDAGLGGGCLLDLGWYAAGAVRFSLGQMPQAVMADVVNSQGVSQRLTALMWFAGDRTATISCGYDASTRKWFEIAGSKASLICDDFTRPWAERPARCWIHDSTGKAESHEFGGNQERSMIEKLISNDSLDALHQQALDTQRILEAIGRSADGGGKVAVG